MLNRRTFLKTGAVALPLTTALDSLPVAALSAEEVAAVATRAPHRSSSLCRRVLLRLIRPPSPGSRRFAALARAT